MAAWNLAAPCASQRLSPAGLSKRQTLPKVESLTAVTVPGLSQFRFPKTLVPLDALPSQMTPACATAAKSSAEMTIAPSLNVMTDFTIYSVKPWNIYETVCFLLQLAGRAVSFPDSLEKCA